jgi:hypothetical protein
MSEEETGGVILAALIWILSMAMFFFYFQVTCQRILRRQFDREYSQSIANAIRLEFPSMRKSTDWGAVAAWCPRAFRAATREAADARG